MNNMIDACTHLFSTWKKNQKNKKKIPINEIESIKNQAFKIPNYDIKIIIATTKFESTSIAGSIIKEPNFIVHIFDGNKITSAASDNVDIDLNKEIAPKIGKILGGSGGGKPKLTQSGGPEKDKIKKALNLAKELTIKNINKKI